MKTSRYISLLICFFPILPYVQKIKRLTINGQHFTGYLDDSGFYVFNSRRDTIFKRSAGYFESFEFKDFNNDGEKDILLGIRSQNPNTRTLYLFHSSEKNFVEVKNFDDFPAPEPLVGTKFYYSYYSVGCGDNSWISDLFYLKGDSIIKAGTIQANGCGKKNDMKAYKLNNGKENLIEALGLGIVKKHPQFKWKFIKRYWTKSYKRFA